MSAVIDVHREPEMGDPDFLKRMAEESLLPELEAYVRPAMFGRMLSHPLVIELAVDAAPGWANRRYKAKKQALEEAIEANDLERIIFLHEKPYRFDALTDYVLIEGNCIWAYTKKYQDLAIQVWVNSDNIYQYRDEWRELFQGRRNGEMLGSRSELASFRKLPDEFRVYRGGGDSSFLTWTTDEEVAKRFTYVPSGDIESIPRKVRTRMMNKSDCFAYFTRRGESEVLSFEGEGE